MLAKNEYHANNYLHFLPSKILFFFFGVTTKVKVKFQIEIFVKFRTIQKILLFYMKKILLFAKSTIWNLSSLPMKLNRFLEEIRILTLFFKGKEFHGRPTL